MLAELIAQILDKLADALPEQAISALTNLLG